MAIEALSNISRAGTSAFATGGGVGVTRGEATIDFGAFPGSCEALIAVTGQSAILSSDIPFAFFGADDTTGDHTASDHRYAASLISLSCGVPADGVGFTIYGRCLDKMQGSFKIRWFY